MKKIMVTIAVIFLGVIVCTPYVTGRQLEQSYYQQIEAMPAQPGISIENQSYERGWFSSSVRTQVELDLQAISQDPDLSDTPLRLLIESSLKHGPIVLSQNGVRLGLGSGELNLIAPQQPYPDSAVVDWLKQAPVQLNTFVFFNRSTQTEMHVQAYSKDGADVDVRFGGAMLQLTMDSTYTKMDGNLVVQPSSLVADGRGISLGEISGSMSYAGINSMLVEGESVLKLDSVSVVDETLNLKLQNLAVNSGSNKNAGGMDIFQTLEFEVVESPVPIESGKWHMELNGIPLAALEQWSELAVDFEKLGQQSAVDAETSEFQTKLQQLMDELNKPGINMLQQIDLAALGGKHELKLAITYMGMQDGVNLMQVEDPMEYVKALQGSLYFQGDEQAIASSPLAGMVMPFTEQGILVAEDGKIKLDAKLDNEAVD